MATINDVSALANVSISTVSRVINNTATVKKSTRERVFSAMEQLGYQPNIFAQGLVTNRSKNVTLVLTDLTGAYFGPLVKSVENTLRAANYNLIISVENEELSGIRKTFQELVARRSDAVIFFPHCLTDEEVLELKRGAPPMVLLHRYIPSLGGQSIAVDNVLGSSMAVEYLIERGHRKIAFIKGQEGNSEAAERYLGYCNTLAKHHIEFDPALTVSGDFTVASGMRAVKQLLQQKVEFTAIFAGNDQMAAGAMKALQQAGRRVPEDVSVVGFDDVEFAGMLTPELTTIKQPSEEMGRVAAGLVLKLMQGETGLTEIPLFTPKLIERNSVRALNQ